MNCELPVIELLLDPNARIVPLTQGRYALVDAEDYEAMMAFRWWYHSEGYACRSVGGGNKPRFIFFMHREIAGTPEGLDTDHRMSGFRGCGLDNRRANLRICTTAENIRNQGIRSSNRSGFKGVSYSQKDRVFRAWIRSGNKNVCLGGFSTAELAYERYKAAAVANYGEFARI